MCVAYILFHIIILHICSTQQVLDLSFFLEKTWRKEERVKIQWYAVVIKVTSLEQEKYVMKIKGGGGGCTEIQ